jgi:hypothetical protein
VTLIILVGVVGVLLLAVVVLPPPLLPLGLVVAVLLVELLPPALEVTTGSLLLEQG